MVLRGLLLVLVSGLWQSVIRGRTLAASILPLATIYAAMGLIYTVETLRSHSMENEMF